MKKTTLKVKDMLKRIDIIKSFKSILDLEGIFIFFLSIAYIGRIGKETSINYFVHLIIAAFLIVIGVYILKLRGDLFTNNKNIFLAAIPTAVAIIYNLLLLLTNQIGYPGRLFSNLIEQSLTVVLAIVTFSLFKKRTIYILSRSVILSFVIVLLINLFNYGLVDILTQIINSIRGIIDARNPLEVHDLTFAAGVILIYLVYTRKENLLVKLFLLLIVITGFKRIQVLAFVASLISFIIITKVVKYDMIKIVGYSLILGCVFFVYSVDSGLLDYVSGALNIQTMGRLSMYKWISLYFSFSPTFMGLGLGASSKMAEEMTKWGIHALHSDILRLFVEQGFMFFILWLIFYSIYIPKKVNTKKNRTLYMVILVYMIILHLTDNTLLYFSTQFVFNSVLLQIIMKGNIDYEKSNYLRNI